MVRRGLRNREIAEVLGLGEQDIKNRLRRLFDKVGVWSRLELAMYVVDHGPNWPPQLHSRKAQRV
jgi:DNA-binding NarL/FixJ family response regulator